MFPNITREVIGGSIIIGIILGIVLDIYTKHIIEEALANEITEEQPAEPKEVRIEVVYDWTPERIEQEIRSVFPEQPNTAVAIAKCESGLKPNIQSHHILSYGREQSFGVMQIHAKDHHGTALRLGYEDYQTDVIDNLAMARYLYDQRGGTFKDWTCYNKGMYRAYL